jgi:putative ABC transport system substrate-binding protein
LLSALWPRAAAQAPAGRRERPLVAYLSAARRDAGTERWSVGPFENGLRAAGRAPGQRLEIAYRFADGQADRLPALLVELLRLEPDLLVAAGPHPALVIRDAMATLPTALQVLMVAIDDPVSLGLAASYARPGGRFTGNSAAFRGILPRRLQLMKDVMPQARRFAILANPLTAPMAELESDLPRWERELGVSLRIVTARRPDEFDAAFAVMVRERVDAAVVLADATFYTHREQLGALCERHRLPAAVGGAGYLESIGVVSFQGDFAELFRRAAAMTVRILDGTPAGEIPWEQSTKHELIVHLKRARALGLNVPQRVLVAADEVIE